MGYFRVSHAGYHWVNWPNLPFSTHFDHFANHFWYGCFMLLVLANPCIWWLVLFAGGFLFFNTIAKPPAFIWSIRMYIKDVLLVLRLYHLPSECLSQAHQDCWNSSIVFMPDKYYLLFIGGQKTLPRPITPLDAAQELEIAPMALNVKQTVVPMHCLYRWLSPACFYSPCSLIFYNRWDLSWKGGQVIRTVK